MGGYEEGIFCQGSCNKRLSTGEVGVRIGPGSHPCRLFDFDGVVVEIASGRRFALGSERGQAGPGDSLEQQ